MTLDTRTHRTRTALMVLEGARDAGDETMVAVCSRVLQADRLGWRKHGNAADMELVYEFSDMLKA